MLGVILTAFLSASAQHQHPAPKKETTMQDTLKRKHPSKRMKMQKKMPADTVRRPKQKHDMHHMDSMQHMDHGSMMQMQGGDIPMGHSYSLNLPMSRNGSGTSWLPDDSPMYGIMLHSKKWMYMLHGNIDLRYTKQDLGDKGTRGDDVFDAPNWFMAMGQRKVGSSGLFHFSSMISLDRFTEGGNGYPLLFQTGESWQDVPLIDRQHPHDLFSELSVGYSHAFSRKADLIVYLGYPGEPAIGSTAFMHRPSAFPNPDAPIGHHWNDGTHITFGVATLGFRYDKFKIEASSYTGREPNENRLDFDKPRFDSWSGRLSFNPTKKLALQVSRAFVKSPEALHPEDDVDRTIASAIYSNRLGEEKFLNLTTLWGVNKYSGHDGENTALLEGSLRLNRTVFYTRYEWVQKSTEELGLDELQYGEHTLFPVNALTLGLNHDLFRWSKFRLAGGAHLTGFSADSRLNSLYGKNPLSGQVFLRLYPALMKM